MEDRNRKRFIHPGELIEMEKWYAANKEHVDRAADAQSQRVQDLKKKHVTKAQYESDYDGLRIDCNLSWGKLRILQSLGLLTYNEAFQGFLGTELAQLHDYLTKIRNP